MAAELIVGLGPIGASVGERLLERGRSVVGFELDPARAKEWSQANGVDVVSSAAGVAWADVGAVHIAVRLASQLEQVIAMLREHARADVTVIVLTTLAPSDAQRILSGTPAGWRVFEAPLSGGPQGALAGTMTLMLAGPEPSVEDEQRFADMSGTLFWTPRYGQPALLKLLNNTLGAYNALATAAMLELAIEHGINAQQFLEVVSVSSGQSWMSVNFDNFHYPLLFKDAGLLIGDLGAVPAVQLGDQPAHEAVIERVRAKAFGEHE
ncbi:NAD(P)-binding domain-containing protein [Arthrobacter sp. I2-34]|uniref:NAD(P)-binding domain-containing protein n=1 Tax=Arthrobacter hankyongi TaxID=2904801 RepID=A0ABS9LAG5_9MICC|nr:NAD(P)-binding domain-containing protein [Arthrobacter hankyongi]MCG2623679.1 NAD(P)-binding domain-containing protein [Arthrobacter hankyongi]